MPTATAIEEVVPSSMPLTGLKHHRVRVVASAQQPVLWRLVRVLGSARLGGQRSDRPSPHAGSTQNLQL